MKSVLICISSSEWLDNRWKPQKGEGNTYSPKENTIFSFCQYISHHWIQMGYCVLDFHINNRDKKHKS